MHGSVSFCWSCLKRKRTSSYCFHDLFSWVSDILIARYRPTLITPAIFTNRHMPCLIVIRKLYVSCYLLHVCVHILVHTLYTYMYSTNTNGSSHMSYMWLAIASIEGPRHVMKQDCLNILVKPIRSLRDTIKVRSMIDCFVYHSHFFCWHQMLC